MIATLVLALSGASGLESQAVYPLQDTRITRGHHNRDDGHHTRLSTGHMDDEPDTGRVVKNYDRTSLRAPLELFDKFCDGLGSEIRMERGIAKEHAEMKAPETGDW